MKHIIDAWNAMLESGKMPLFEIELKDDEFLLVDIELFSHFNEIRFSFDAMNLKSHFSGDVKEYNGCKFSIALNEYDSLDMILEQIYEEVTQGFILPNNLFPLESE